MNSPALICQPVSASDNKNPPLDKERERNRTRKSNVAKEGINIFDLYFRIYPPLRLKIFVDEKCIKF
jgi:hypothetical protein